MKWGFAKKAIIKSQRQFMDGSNFYESDVNQTIHESFSIVKTIQGGSYSMEDTNLVNTKYGSFA